MNYDFKQTLLSRCLLSGLLAGFIAVVANFIFNYIYREITGYVLDEVINVVSIILSSIIATLVAGVLYFIFAKMKNGRAIFTVLMLLITAVCMFFAFQTHRTDDPVTQHQFKVLFAGILFIDGMLGTFAVPYLTSHPKLYS